MKSIIPAICVLLLGGGGQSVHVHMQNAHKTILTSSTAENNKSVSIVLPQSNNGSMLMGTNALYWVETDQRRAQPEYLDNLKKLKIQTMRFPGGEVADNYDWRTNTLNDPKRWPTSKSPDDAKKRMDFDEFMQLQKALSSEPLIVVNLENGFVTGDLEEAADVAAAWVRYANVEKHYNVKYWEIGNESYLIQTRYPLTAKEYAKAFNLFAKKMKAVDPTIKLGANGPFRMNGVAMMDKLTKVNQRIVLKVHNGKKRKKTAQKLLKQQKEQNKIKWWRTLFQKVGDNIDFIALHYYITERRDNTDMKKPLLIGRILQNFKIVMNQQVGRELPIFITEWNIDKNNTLNQQNYKKTVQDAIISYKKNKISRLYFWPMFPTGKRQFKAYSTIFRK